MFNNDYPLEIYVLAQLKKHSHNVDRAIKAIRNKYPFIKSADLKNIISEVLIRKVNNDKISGFWKKIENDWKLVKADEKQGAGYSWSGPELPASSDESSIGNGLGVYSTPGDRPDGKSPRQHKEKDGVKSILEVDTMGEDTKTTEEIQKLYEKMMTEYSGYVKPIPERSEIVIEELKERGYDTSKIVPQQ
jgi:hypothetical protein